MRVAGECVTMTPMNDPVTVATALPAGELVNASAPRLVAIDLDGTLLDRHGRVPERSRAAVRALGSAGVRVVLATGRSRWSAAPVAEQLGLSGPHVLMQGGLVADTAEGTRVWSAPQERQAVLEQLAFAREHDLEPILGYEHGYRAERLTPDLRALAWPMYAEGARMELVPSLETTAGDGVIRTFLFTSPGRHAEVRRAARERFGDRLSITWGDDFGIEFLAPGVSKGAALRMLAASVGLRMPEVAAIGDGRNDLEMLAEAGHSAAMETASPEVRAAADLVVPSSAEEGVVVALLAWFPWLERAIGTASDAPAA